MNQEADLIALGLSEKEAKVYMTLLKTGPSAASTLARLTQIKRTSMYDVLNSLLQQGLISQFKQGSTTQYVVDDINRLTQEAKGRLNIAKDLVRDLKDSQRLGEGIQVNYYKGQEGYREIYEDILRVQPKELIGWMNLDHFYEGLDMKREDSWTRERVRKRISARFFVAGTKVGERFQSEDSEFLRQSRLVEPKSFPFKTTCLIYGDFIAFFDATKEFTGIRIHNPELANMHRQIFEMGWNQNK